ncbi:DeoR/GlpR family transcriptional regulator [Vibrio sp. SCSIO 43136]|uniref:DeoR/GlpR family transcriptional regulator n=1 Tax=Vibrio sp. SCSIO 43136 TaxID=2819101 RepID=UPI0020759754|nr:DeoR/GlpR family transcriptional regulator [Vibrio sp. SCSIO 43136]USD67638.1 DeoR/GlpR family transcriptional regulator [Vibrio sp. SCSIO 43136]
MKITKRQQAIIELVQTNGQISTDELVEHFNVSPQTIRRDLNDLAQNNKLRRSHGGASTITSAENTPYQSRQDHSSLEKAQIAKTLVKHIPDGATLFIDIGTTPEAIARALLENHQQLRIVTNNINAATILMSNPDFKVILAGGEVRNRDGGVTGEATVDFIEQFRLDFGILGISGIDGDGSLLDFDYHEVRVKRAIIENSRSVLLGVDHTKFGRSAMVKLGNLSEVDLVITDAAPDKQLQDLLKESEVKLEVTQP